MLNNEIFSPHKFLQGLFVQMFNVEITCFEVKRSYLVGNIGEPIEMFYSHMGNNQFRLDNFQKFGGKYKIFDTNISLSPSH